MCKLSHIACWSFALCLVACTAASHEFRTPSWLVGNCSTIWVSVQSYYKLPYLVEFRSSGSWTWKSPFVKGGAEFGEGRFLSAPVVLTWPNGSWAATAQDASRYSPGGITTCCCMHVGAHGTGAPIVLSEYCKGDIPGRFHDSMSDVCRDSKAFAQPCPTDNESLREAFGDPFVEVYSSCTVESLHAGYADVDLSGILQNAHGMAFISSCGLIFIFASSMCVVLRYFRSPCSRVSPGGIHDLEVQE